MGQATITVKTVGEGPPAWTFQVRVQDSKSVSDHEVTLTQQVYESLSRKAVPPAQFVEAAFRFLLEREPKESILSQFDVAVISRYFPEFTRTIGEYL